IRVLEVAGVPSAWTGWRPAHGCAQHSVGEWWDQAETDADGGTATASSSRVQTVSLCASSFERLSARPPITSAPVALTAPVRRSRLLPGLRAKVQNVAARLARMVGRFEIDAAPHGAWPTMNSP